MMNLARPIAGNIAVDIDDRQLKSAEFAVSSLPRRTMELFLSLEGLSAELAGSIPSGKFIRVSDFWGRKNSAAGQGSCGRDHIEKHAKFLGMTTEGLKVIEREERCPAGGDRSDAYIVVGKPSLVSCLRAALSSSVEYVRNTVGEAVRANNFESLHR